MLGPQSRATRQGGGVTPTHTNSRSLKKGKQQLVGHNIVVRASADGAVSDDDLARALSASQTDFERDVCETTLSSLSGKDVEFLCAMAHDDGPSRMANVADRMDATVDYAQKYRRRLIDAGVIESASRGYVRFAVPFLRDYLRNRE